MRCVEHCGLIGLNRLAASLLCAFPLQSLCLVTVCVCEGVEAVWGTINRPPRACRRHPLDLRLAAGLVLCGRERRRLQDASGDVYRWIVDTYRIVFCVEMGTKKTGGGVFCKLVIRAFIAAHLIQTPPGAQDRRGEGLARGRARSTILTPFD